MSINILLFQTRKTKYMSESFDNASRTIMKVTHMTHLCIRTNYHDHNKASDINAFRFCPVERQIIPDDIKCITAACGTTFLNPVLLAAADINPLVIIAGCNFLKHKSKNATIFREICILHKNRNCERLNNVKRNTNLSIRLRGFCVRVTEFCK